MRVLVVSHTYVVNSNRQKLVSIAAIPGVELGLVVPAAFRDTLMQSAYEFARLPGEEYPIFRAKTFFPDNIFRYFYSPSIVPFLREFKPDIIHVEQEYWSTPLFQMAALRELLARGSKLLFFGWQNIYEQYSLPYSFFERFNLSKADYAIAGNGEAADVLRRKGFRKQVKVLPQLGIDAVQFSRKDCSATREKLGLDSFVVGFVGRLNEAKGVRTLVEAAAKVTGDVQLLFVGRGELKAQLEQMARELGVRAVFVDSVLHDEVPAYLSCMDTLVLPSRTTKYWKEQFGHVLIEAMACEVPVIGSSSAAIPEVIGDAGLVFEEGNAADLAGKLNQLLGSTDLRQTFIEKGRQRVLANYTHERIAAETHAVYKEMLGR